MTDSIWKRDCTLPRFPALEGDCRTDVLIIGGGLAGILCAKRLTDAGVDCILIEENRLMEGVSGRTTAKVTSQHGLIYSTLLQRLGKEKAKRYWQANEDALDTLRNMAVDCDFQEQSSYLYTISGTEKLESEMAAYRELQIPAQWKISLPLPFQVKGAIELPYQGQIHPLKLVSGIVHNLKIYENTKALAFVGKKVQTSRGNITAEKIVVATHFPLLNKHGAYFLKMYQQRSYVIALKNTPPLDGMYLDCEENGLSLRSTGEYLLLGGGGHRTGKKGLCWRLPEAAARKYYPQCPVAYRWATQDCMSLDGIPYIGQYSKQTPNLYVATGFQKWGMTSSMVAAKILTELIQGREDPYDGLFSPSRSVLHKQLFINGLEAASNLLRPTTPRCPHLGCALHWNQAEHSWDCACHGSRFDSNGKVLNNPATSDMKHSPKQ